MLRKIQIAKATKGNLLHRYRMFVVAFIMIILIIVLWISVKNIFFSDEKYAGNKIELSIEKNDSVGISQTVETQESMVSVDGETSNDVVNEYILSAGDTLAKILESYGIGFSEVYEITKKYPALATQLHPGQVISWTVDEEGHLQMLTWIVNRKESRVYEKTEDGFVESIEMTQGEFQEVVFGSVIGYQGKNTFIGSAQDVGLTTTERYNAARFLEYQVSFKSLRLGDQFSVLVEREFVNDEHMGSRFLAAKIRNNNKNYYAIYFDKYRGYYDDNGSPLADGFLRIPTIKEKKYRVSSNFNPNRLHPVTRRRAPHNGVDFAMPIGVSVLAAGDGEIVISRYSPTAGNYVAVRHGKQYSTRYMHMSKRLVRAGQIVKRGDVIGLSGNTGRSTGPHLHYEFHINNKPVNPITVHLPRPEGLKGDDLLEFRAYVKQVKEKLDNPVLKEEPNETQLAMIDVPDESNDNKRIIDKIDAPFVSLVN